MTGLPYYKAYPRDFLESTAGMTFEEKGAYRLVLDLIYMQSGRLPDDSRYVAGLLGCSVRKWNALREALIDRGKIHCENGIISNFRADKELEKTRKYQDNQRENRSISNKNKELDVTTVQPARALDTDTDTYNPPISPQVEKDDYSRIVSSWNKVADEFELPRVQAVTDRRASRLRGRIEQVGGEEAFLRAIALVGESKFLTGRAGTQWKCNFDFLLQPSSLQKLIEGSYGTPPLDAYKPVDDDEIERRKARLREMQEQGLVL